jgi:hypothetical protein
VDCKYVTEKPLYDFVYWILHNFNQKYETIALSHYGGRYDMVMVFGEIFRQGGLAPSIIKQGNKLYKIVVEKKGIITKTSFHDT